MKSHERLGPPPVEGLSDVAWARVEKNVFQRLGEGTITHAAAARELRGKLPSTEKRGWLWLAIPAAAAAAAAVVFFSLHAPPPSGQVAATGGDDEPSRVVAGEAQTSVSFGDAHITLDAHSALVMDRAAARPTALLEHGAATFAIAPRGDRPPFVVLAGDLQVRVIGTRFRVVREGEHSEVSVDHGTVEVTFRGSDVRVGAHQHWTSDDPNRVTPDDSH